MDKQNKAHRYALEKVYLSGTYEKDVEPGSLVLIYRMGETYPKKYSSVVTGIAILGEMIHTNNKQECLDICKNRSIFTKEEIENKYGQRPTVIKLLDYVAFKNKIYLDTLYKEKIIEKNSGPRPFHLITKEQFELIYRLGMEEEQ